MLVYTKKPVIDYGPIQRLAKNVVCIVYALQKDGTNTQFAVYPLREKNYDYQTVEQPDPLFFDAENFEVIVDLASQKWQTHTPYQGPLKDATVTSAPIWFTNDIAGKVHDWDLGLSDYPLLTPLMHEYNELYWQYIESHTLHLLKDGLNYMWRHK